MKLLLISFLLSNSLYASVVSYIGDGSEKVFIENVQGDEAFIKMEGVKSLWANKIIKTKLENKRTFEAYTFDYFIELSSGKQKRSYTPIVTDREVLFNGSMVKTIKIFFPGGNRNGLLLKHDLNLSQASQQLDLVGKYKKEPYNPVMD